MKKLLFLLLLLPTFVFSQTINFKNDNYYVLINTLDSTSLDENFNANLVDVTSWGTDYTHRVTLDTLNNEISMCRVNIVTQEEYDNTYIILEEVFTEYGKIYKLGGYDGSYAFIYLNEGTMVFGIELDYGIYKGVMCYVE
mgnify:CR=1 FL=1